MLHRVLRAVHTVVTLGRFVTPNPMQETPETAVSSENLRQAGREDAVASLELFLKEGLTAAIAAYPIRITWIFLGTYLYVRNFSTRLRQNKVGILCSRSTVALLHR